MRTPRSRYWWLLAGLVLLLSVFVIGCDDNEDTELNAVLTGQQQVPPVTTNATGVGRVTIPDDNSFIDATLQASGFATDVTAATIRYGRPGEEGPVLFTLFNQAQDGQFPGTITTRLTAADFETQPLGSPIANFSQAVQAIREGNAYFSVDTVGNPGGELRGQIGAAVFRANLSGVNVVPPVETNGDGTATAVITRNEETLGVGVQTTGLTNANVTDIVLRSGKPGSEGPVLFTVYDVNRDGAYTGSATATFTSADLETQPAGSSIDTFEEAVAAVRRGDVYISVDTTTNPNGELRGNFDEQLDD